MTDKLEDISQNSLFLNKCYMKKVNEKGLMTN